MGTQQQPPRLLLAASTCSHWVLLLCPADFYIQFHFVQFLKLYHNPQRDHQALALCRKHMEVGPASLGLPSAAVLAGCLLSLRYYVNE